MFEGKTVRFKYKDETEWREGTVIDETEDGLIIVTPGVVISVPIEGVDIEERNEENQNEG